MSGERADLLGEMAHKKVASWLSSQRVSCNDATRDRHGWDLIAQFAQADGASAGPELSCLLQVKGLDKGSSFRVSLANLKRFVENPLPCFFVVLDYQGGSEPVRQFLVHFGEELIERTLRKLQTLPSDAQLSKSRLSIRVGRREAIEEPASSKLVREFRVAIGDPLDYTQKKIAFVRKVGFEERPYNVDFSVEAESDEERFQLLSDWAIGLVEELPIRSFAASVTRFGVTRPDSRLEGGYVAAVNSPTKPDEWNRPHINDVRLRIASPGGTSFVETSGTLLDSHFLIPFIPLEHRKLRFSRPGLELVVNVRDSGIRIDARLPAPDQKLTVAELCHRVAVHRALSASGGLHLSIIVEGDIVCEMESPALVLDERAEHFMHPIDQLSRLTAPFGLDIRERVEPRSIFAVKDALDDLCRIFSHTAADFSYEVVVDTSPEEIGTFEKAAIVNLRGFVLGDCVVGGVIALVGELASVERMGDQSKIKAVNVKPLVLRELRSECSVWSPEKGRAMVRSAVQDYEATHVDYLVIEIGEGHSKNGRD